MPLACASRRRRHGKGGELALQEISRRKPVRKNRIANDIEEAIVALAIDQPGFGQVRVGGKWFTRTLRITLTLAPEIAGGVFSTPVPFAL